jgi:PLP dependent protein
VAGVSDPRLVELEESLAAVRHRIEAAATAAHRHPADVHLVAVTKTWPAADVLRLVALGVDDVGESYEQELRVKAGATTAAGVRPRWHFVGRLQRNKCAAVARLADVVHSVDRAELVPALAGGAARAGRHLDVLLQVSLDRDPARGGADPDELSRLADLVGEHAPTLRLRGLMAVPPFGEPPRPHFDRLRQLRDDLAATRPEVRWLSAGMSADLADAVAAGATHVRVGTALLGNRRPSGR